MNIDETLFSPAITNNYTSSGQRSANQSGQKLPSKEDSISISAEAFALAKQMYLENSSKNSDKSVQEEKANQELSKEVDKKDEDASALRDKFTSHLYNSDGKSRDSAPKTVAEQIEKLEGQIKTLQAQLVKIADSGMIGEVETITAQIEGLSAQISALKNGTPAEQITSAAATKSKK